MIAWGVFTFIIISISIFSIRPRLQHSVTQRKVDISYAHLRKIIFWLLALSTILQALSQYLPAVYLPSYAVDFRATPENGALLLTYFNLASVLGQPTLGVLADTQGVALPLLLSTFFSAFAVLIIWGFSHAYWSTLLVSIVFGGFSGGFVVLRNRFATAIVGNAEHPNQELIISGLLMLIRGVSTFASGFIGQAIVKKQAGKELGRDYGANKWRGLLLTDGLLMAAASCGALGFLGKRRLRGTAKAQ